MNVTEESQKTGRWFRLVVIAQVATLAVLLGVVVYQRLLADTPSDSEEGTAMIESTSQSPTDSQDAVLPVNRNLPDELPTDPHGGSQSSPDGTQRGKSRVASRPRRPSAESEFTTQPLPKLRNPSIYIEKSKLRLTVFDDGQVVKRYRAAIGGGRGDKVREGDRCTPEGTFYVCVKNEKSKFVKSLGLSYPNAEDAQRGLRAGLITPQQSRRIQDAIRDQRQPPWDTPLGGEIMIHGQRLGGRDTLGCIALEDADILELFPQIPPGTPVVIVP